MNKIECMSFSFVTKNLKSELKKKRVENCKGNFFGVENEMWSPMSQ